MKELILDLSSPYITAEDGAIVFDNAIAQVSVTEPEDPNIQFWFQPVSR